MNYKTDEARRIFADHGLIARVSAEGGILVVYEGEEHSPGTWMEISRIQIQNGEISGSAFHQVMGSEDNPCPKCDGSGFSGQGSGYGDVCTECGGTGEA